MQFLGLELDLHRLTTDEALCKLDDYLSEVYQTGLHSVRIVHGKGTGTLRLAVRRELKHHPLVKSFRPAFAMEGGDGATVVQMVD